MTAVYKFFGYDKMTDFRADWNRLDDASKKQLRDGITDGTLTY